MREAEEEGGVMKYIESGRANMRIEESAAKKQGKINLGRDVVVGYNKYRVDKDNRDDSKENGYGNEVGEDAVDTLRINNAAVRESQIRRIG